MDEDGHARIEIIIKEGLPKKVTTSLSRSLGDRFASNYGVISQPDIKCYDLTPGDLFVVWASDGVWSMLENDEVCGLVGFKLKTQRDDLEMNLEAVTKKLVNETNAVWQDECFGYTDDITAVVGRIGPRSLLEQKKT
ncbi:Protein phosphatase 2C containing protein [Reticulomyxa filosa]|uniref:Protein phosphatase 2C containing protein n=1 Tax=Reticulomyxa filosa TaxID=46433 RepID=X6MAG0_RETFI|nr:Protein phosphatase 2C containing protein [Reticulomyxa filosa]|eukprot:ETO10656.1 Protein phosphatase 2C containing protein [Reticulomyxa filosa]